MKLDDLKKNYPPVSAAGHAQFMRTLANLKEEEPVKKKLSLSLALALVLILALAATAIALVTSYSVKDHIDPKFIDQITQIDQSYENDYLSLSINDALADAKSLFVAMNMTHKPGAPEVYVFPFVTAESQGKALDVDIESGFDFYDGAWLPERAPSSEGPGNYSLDMAIMEDRMPGAQDDITWTLTFHVLKPNWPIETDQYSARGYYEGEGKIAHEDYEQLFRDATRTKKSCSPITTPPWNTAPTCPCPKASRKRSISTCACGSAWLSPAPFPRWTASAAASPPKKENAKTPWSKRPAMISKTTPSRWTR